MQIKNKTLRVKLWYNKLAKKEGVHMTPEPESPYHSCKSNNITTGGHVYTDLL